METTKINKTWDEWIVKERCISLEVARDAGLLYRGPLSGSLVIPVYDIDGAHLFNKYRRSPILSAGPKYRYDAGASRALFGAEQLKDLAPGSLVIVSEGELDALALRTLGYTAVSSTGGASTWSEDFSKLLEPYTVVLFYDADEPGVSGMFHAATYLKNAYIAFMPVEYGKDSTEVIFDGHEGAIRQAIIDKQMFAMPWYLDAPEVQMITLGKIARELALLRQEILRDPARTPFHIDLAFKWVADQLRRQEKELFTFDASGNPRDNSKVEGAKAYPIRSMVKVNAQGFARCPFHEDSTASFKVYQDNHAFCFGGCGRKSSIDIYMFENRTDFKTAIKELSEMTP